MRSRAGRLVVVAAMAASAVSMEAVAYSVRGTVLDVEGAPIAGARAWLTVSRESRVANTGIDGRFNFDDVSSGPAQLVVYADTFALGGMEGPIIRNEDVSIVLEPPRSTRVRVINMRYEAIEGARVSRMTVNDRFTAYVEDLAELGFPVNRSDEDGFLDLPPLPRDAFLSVTFAGAGYADAQLPALPAGIENLDVPLPDGVAVVGRVMDADGGGVARARVSIYRPREEGGAVHAAEALTGPEGFYRALVPPGAYFAAARHPDFAMPDPAPIDVRALDAETVADLRLRDPHRIDGRALDMTGSPVALARFEYHSGDFVVDETVSDVRGHFELTVPEGPGAIHVTPPYRMATKEFPRVYLDIRAAEAVVRPSAIEFRPLPELESRVLLADGSPATRALIESLDLDPPVFVLTGDDGAFTIALDAFPEAKIRFRVEDALQLQRAEIELDPKKLALSEVRLRPFEPEAALEPEKAANDLRALVGRPAPEFACDAWFNLPPGADSPSVASLRGKVVVVTMWAGFDFLGPSRARANELNAIHALYEGVEDVAFVGIHDSTVEPGDVARYVRQLGVAYPVGCDQEPYETFARYLTRQIPQTVLIDKRGLLRYYSTDGRLVELIKVLRNE